jgi:hypothetical protein
MVGSWSTLIRCHRTDFFIHFWTSSRLNDPHCEPPQSFTKPYISYTGLSSGWQGGKHRRVFMFLEDWIYLVNFKFTVTDSYSLVQLRSERLLSLSQSCIYLFIKFKQMHGCSAQYGMMHYRLPRLDSEFGISSPCSHAIEVCSLHLAMISTCPCTGPEYQ